VIVAVFSLSAADAGHGLHARALQSEGIVHATSAAIDGMLKRARGPNATETIAELKPYVVRIERRAPRPDPAVGAHRGQAEFYYVLDGAAVLVTGARPNDSSSVARREKIAKGDVVFIPEDTIHWWDVTEGSISYIAMRVPR
jgi:mannose-6-phosphate isomerase-like protein (cupin superfamily)